MSVPSSLLEASGLRDLEHNGSEEMIIMIMIMMTRKKMRSRLSFPNHEQKTTAFPLDGRHLLEVENCKIASFSMVFLSPPNCVYSHWHNLSPTGWMECIYWWDAPKKSFIYLRLFFHFHFPNDRRYLPGKCCRQNRPYVTNNFYINFRWLGRPSWMEAACFFFTFTFTMTGDNDQR